ncbi:hypothetical protein HR060_14505 [Catenovulum sp. SM1970]|nr:hypothetical protein [Marinifaba aquimaris]NTS78068.1 hypothetical protein [Marinifaba aquimaris]
MTDLTTQQDLSEESDKLLNYSQLCNVFYERELKLLTDCKLPAEQLAKRMASLPFYIKRAAESLISLDNPLELDTQNGTWSAKQKKIHPADKITEQENQAWLAKYVCLGLVLPVCIVEKGVTQFRLDSVDEINNKDQRFHLNEQGWFYFSGKQCEQSQSEFGEQLGLHQQKKAFKSTKDIISAACCGHQWIASDRTFQRALSLRELLLTSVINWKHLNQPLF